MSGGNYLVRADPVELCGYNPCKVAKCVTNPSAMCVSRFNCNPIFFNREGRIIKSCKGRTKLEKGRDKIEHHHGFARTSAPARTQLHVNQVRVKLLFWH